MTPDELRDLKKEHSITNRGLAKLLCVSRSSIENWLSGKRKISRQSARQIELLDSLIRIYKSGFDENETKAAVSSALRIVSK
jgi:transcriptional regulator with XRE-family HTH domain